MNRSEMTEKPDEVNKVTFEEVSSDADMAKEVSTESSDKSHKCPFCDSAFARMPKLKKHIRKHLDEDGYNCPQCDISFTGPGKLRNHLKTHEEGASPFASQLSEPEDSDRDTGKPVGQKSQKCSHCDAAFAVKMNLKKHMKFHAEEEFLQCTSCGVAFLDREALKVHKKTHGGQKPHKCNFCDASFAQAKGLKKHMATHSGEQVNPYVTPDCGGSTQRHVVTHTLELPHYCTPYHSPFSHGDYGKTNIMSNAVDKPYGCNLCGSAFAEPGKLRQHVLAHSGSLMASVGEKPFKCALCDATFSRKAVMVAHRKKHSEGENAEHGLEDPHTSDDQSKETEPSSELDADFRNLRVK